MGLLASALAGHVRVAGHVVLESPRLRDDTDVRLRRLPALRVLLLGVVVGDEPAMTTSSPGFQFTGVPPCAWR